uniref:SPRY domain-containing protein 7 n=1 Tax=Ciona intestinalis TaxID=7719 RepID=F6UC03_CIOIN|nr:SPRY domain-containing protein 7-like [Ciona intestinalis]|eukprot:XP_002124704.2 SPRY domain-containing protein 7-like [Ciona intestinalis]
MSAYTQCFYRCFGWSASSANNPITNHDQPKICLDTTKMGTDAVIVKNGKRICGTGGGLANAPIAQDKAYFQVKLQSTGIFGIGVGLETAELDRVPLGEDANSWVLRHDGFIRHNKKTVYETNIKFSEGDFIGVSYDHIELNFYVNGKNIGSPVLGIRGICFPLVIC